MSLCALATELLEVLRIAEAVQHPLVLRLEKRVFEPRQLRAARARPGMQDELEGPGQRAFDRRAGELGVALSGVRVAHREQPARDRDRVVHRRALADAPVVDVAAHPVRRDRVDHVRLGRRQPDHPEVRPDRNANVLQHAVLLLHGLVVHRHARIVDDLVHHAERDRSAASTGSCRAPWPSCARPAVSIS